MEVGNHLSIRYMGFLLAGQGADVIAVSSMHADKEATLNHPLNAGKRFIEAADMTSADFRYHVERLARRTDVLLSATLSRPKFEWLRPSEISQRNASLISCDVTATNTSDPQNYLPGDEAIIAAAAGLHCGVLEDDSAP